jgi:hypothetical protein
MRVGCLAGYMVDGGVGEKNIVGENVLAFSVSNDMGITNTFFKKRKNQYITYKSGEN